MSQLPPALATTPYLGQFDTAAWPNTQKFGFHLDTGVTGGGQNWIGDGITFSDGSMVAGSNVFTSANNTESFHAADIGKLLIIEYAGAGATSYPGVSTSYGTITTGGLVNGSLMGYIGAVSGHTCQLFSDLTFATPVNAGASVTPSVGPTAAINGCYGTDSTAAILATVALSGSTGLPIKARAGKYLSTQPIPWQGYTYLPKLTGVMDATWLICMGDNIQFIPWSGQYGWLEDVRIHSATRQPRGPNNGPNQASVGIFGTAVSSSSYFRICNVRITQFARNWDGGNAQWAFSAWINNIRLGDHSDTNIMTPNSTGTGNFVGSFYVAAIGTVGGVNYGIQCDGQIQGFIGQINVERMMCAYSAITTNGSPGLRIMAMNIEECYSYDAVNAAGLLQTSSGSYYGSLVETNCCYGGVFLTNLATDGSGTATGTINNLGLQELTNNPFLPGDVLTLSSTSQTTNTIAYNSTTGVVTLTFLYSFGSAAGSNITVSGAAGTGSFASLNGAFAVSNYTGNTVSYVIATGLTLTATSAVVVQSWATGAVTILTTPTPATFTFAAGGANLSCTAFNTPGDSGMTAWRGNSASFAQPLAKLSGAYGVLEIDRYHPRGMKRIIGASSLRGSACPYVTNGTGNNSKLKINTIIYPGRDGGLLTANLQVLAYSQSNTTLTVYGDRPHRLAAGSSAGFSISGAGAPSALAIALYALTIVDDFTFTATGNTSANTGVTPCAQTVIASYGLGLSGQLAISSGTYVSATGVWTLAMAATMAGKVSVGAYIDLINPVGTGNGSTAAGHWPVLSVSGTTITFQGTVGSGTSALTGGYVAPAIYRSITNNVATMVFPTAHGIANHDNIAVVDPVLGSYAVSSANVQSVSTTNVSNDTLTYNVATQTQAAAASSRCAVRTIENPRDQAPNLQSPSSGPQTVIALGENFRFRVCLPTTSIAAMAIANLNAADATYKQGALLVGARAGDAVIGGWDSQLDVGLVQSQTVFIAANDTPTIPVANLTAGAIVPAAVRFFTGELRRGHS